MRTSGSAWREVATRRTAEHLATGTVSRIEAMHWGWLLDSEIGEILGLDCLTVWHARTLNGIDRHKDPGSRRPASERRAEPGPRPESDD